MACERTFWRKGILGINSQKTRTQGNPPVGFTNCLWQLEMQKLIKRQGNPSAGVAAN